jgi:hypothetical protein
VAPAAAEPAGNGSAQRHGWRTRELIPLLSIQVIYIIINLFIKNIKCVNSCSKDTRNLQTYHYFIFVSYQ